MQELAAQWNVHLIGGSHPTLTDDGRLLNTAYYFTPTGEIHEQDKIHRTRWEREKWNTDAGDQLRLFETPFGKIAILICYDIEFPELARMVCEAGADILFVPSYRRSARAFCGCATAAMRAIENQVFVVMTSTVGNLAVEGSACTTARRASSRRRISLRPRRHRRRRHGQHRADRRRRCRPRRPRKQPPERHHHPAVRQTQGRHEHPVEVVKVG